MWLLAEARRAMDPAAEALFGGNREAGTSSSHAKMPVPMCTVVSDHRKLVWGLQERTDCQE